MTSNASAAAIVAAAADTRGLAWRRADVPVLDDNRLCARRRGFFPSEPLSPAG